MFSPKNGVRYVLPWSCLLTSVPYPTQNEFKVFPEVINPTSSWICPSVISLVTMCIESCEKKAYNHFLKFSLNQAILVRALHSFSREGTIPQASQPYTYNLAFLIIGHVIIGIIFLCIWNSQLCLYNTQSIMIGWCWKITKRQLWTHVYYYIAYFHLSLFFYIVVFALCYSSCVYCWWDLLDYTWWILL